MAATDVANTESKSTVASKEDASSTLPESLLGFWRTILSPFVIFVLNVLTAIVMYMFGGSKKKGGEKKRG